MRDMPTLRNGKTVFQKVIQELMKEVSLFCVYLEINLREATQTSLLPWQTWDLLEIMYHGFKGFCHNFLIEHPEYFIIPVRISGSAIESVFSCLKHISGANLSSNNYASSITALATQRERTGNTNDENSYRNVSLRLK